MLGRVFLPPQKKGLWRSGKNTHVRICIVVSLCMYACMYVCICICICIYICICVYIFIYIYMCVCACVFLYVFNLICFSDIFRSLCMYLLYLSQFTLFNY